MRRALAAGAALALASACAATASPGGLSGTYRAVVTAPALRAAGIPAQEATFDAGVWTLTLGPRRWTMRQTRGIYGNTFAEGDLKVAGHRALFTLTRIDGAAHHEFIGPTTWTVKGSTLRFRRAGIANIYELHVLVAQPWARVR